MPEFSLVSFNCHAGLQARRNGVCEPYDLAGVLRGFDADVIVVQESFAADGERSAAALVAEELGATVHELPFGRAHLALERGPRGASVVVEQHDELVAGSRPR